VKFATGTVAALLTVIVLVVEFDPLVFVAVKVTVKLVFALTVYVCDGFCDVDDVLSPKFHNHEVGEFVLVSVNETVSGLVPDVGFAVNDATGTNPGLTVTVLVVELDPLVFVAVNVTVKIVVVPTVYVCDGFCDVDVVLSPKFHNHEVGAFVLVSVNVTVNGLVPDVGVAVNEATGVAAVA
jgi:hypothetical protein